MSLSTEKEKAITELEDLLTQMRSKTEVSDSEFARHLIELLFKWISQSEITYTSGLVAGANPVTGTFKGGLK